MKKAILILTVLIMGLFIFGCTENIDSNQTENSGLSAQSEQNGTGHTHAYFIGTPTMGQNVAMDSISYKLTYSIKDEEYLSTASIEDLNQADILILYKNNKVLNSKESSNLSKFLLNGGKVISILTLNNRMPVECYTGGFPVNCDSSNTKSYEVTGRVYIQDSNNPITNKSELIIPTQSEDPQEFFVFSVQPRQGSKSLAYIKSETSPQTFSALVKEGNVIYFNYDPGFTTSLLAERILYFGNSNN